MTVLARIPPRPWCRSTCGPYNCLEINAQRIRSFLYFYFYTLFHALVARRKATASTPFVQAVKESLTSRTHPTLLSVPAELAVGFVAGVASRAVSTPLSVVTVRMQTETDDDDNDDDTPASQNRSPHFSEVARRIYSEDGLAGFWTGSSGVVLSGDLRIHRKLSPRFSADLTALSHARYYSSAVPTSESPTHHPHHFFLPSAPVSFRRVPKRCDRQRTRHRHPLSPSSRQGPRPSLTQAAWTYRGDVNGEYMGAGAQYGRLGGSLSGPSRTAHQGLREPGSDHAREAAVRRLSSARRPVCLLNIHVQHRTCCSQTLRESPVDYGVGSNSRCCRSV